jgi:hypothetical protein
MSASRAEASTGLLCPGVSRFIVLGPTRGEAEALKTVRTDDETLELNRLLSSG